MNNFNHSDDPLKGQKHPKKKTKKSKKVKEVSNSIQKSAYGNINQKTNARDSVDTQNGSGH